MKTKWISIFVLGLFVSSCKLVDLRTATIYDSNLDLEAKGRTLLKASVEAMGYDNLNDIGTYEAKANFTWKFPWSMMPMNSFPGSGRNGKRDHRFRFSAGTFDGSIEYLDGPKAGDIHGLQSWESYQKLDGSPLAFKKDKKRAWGLGTWHYLAEAPARLLASAPIIKYAGKRSFEGIEYDLVFATWGKEEANKEFDQWLLYIHPESKFIDLTEVTIRDFYMPMPNNMAYGTVRYTQRQITKPGIWLPASMELQIKQPKKQGRFVFRAQLSDFKFDAFPRESLYPNANLAEYGDAKPHSK